jgi:hypothetical protein
MRQTAKLGKAKVGRVAVIPPAFAAKVEPSLDELARDINLAHEGCKRAASQMAAYARQAGVLLLEARRRVEGHGWLAWLEVNVDVTPRTAQRYIRIAENWDTLGAKCDTVTHLGVREALNLLADKEAREDLVPEGSPVPALPAPAVIDAEPAPQPVAPRQAVPPAPATPRATEPAPRQHLLGETAQAKEADQAPTPASTASSATAIGGATTSKPAPRLAPWAAREQPKLEPAALTPRALLLSLAGRLDALATDVRRSASTPPEAFRAEQALSEALAALRALDEEMHAADQARRS